LSVVIGILGAVLLIVGVVTVQVAQDRRRRARADAISRDLLAQAAAALGLSEPKRVTSPMVRYTCDGKIGGLDAELGASGRWGRVAVALEVVGLPADVQVLPRPTGRGVEDYYLGVAVDAEFDRFDAHYCIYSSKACTGDALRAAAKTVPHTLLDFAASHFDRAYDIELSATQLVVRPVWEPMREPSSDLVALWRYAERFVRAGLEQQVLRPKR
jgi:hypothetical protein